MTDTEGERAFTPTSGDSVKIRGAHSTGVNGNIDISVFERLKLELEGSQ